MYLNVSKSGALHASGSVPGLRNGSGGGALGHCGRETLNSIGQRLPLGRRCSRSPRRYWTGLPDFPVSELNLGF